MTASYKQLLEAKYNYEVHLYDVNVKLYKMQQEGKPISKQQKHLQRKAELEAKLQQIMRQLQAYVELQQKMQQQQIQQQQKTTGLPPVPPIPPPDIRDTDGESFIEAGLLGLIFNRRRKRVEEVVESEEEEK